MRCELNNPYAVIINQTFRVFDGTGPATQLVGLQGMFFATHNLQSITSPIRRSWRRTIRARRVTIYC